MNCDIGEATEGLENELWRRWSEGRVGEWAVMQVKWQKAWRMSSAMAITMSSAHSPRFPSLHLHHSSFSNPSLALDTSQLILQPFHCFTYITAHFPTLLLPLLRHRIFTYVTWRAAPTYQLAIKASHYVLLSRKIIRLSPLHNYQLC